MEVVGDYDCMLNQTNIGANNNKFYKCDVSNCLPWSTLVKFSPASGARTVLATA